MKITEDFFRVLDVEQSEGELSARVALNKDHFVYSVHFPGHPVTPGVFILSLLENIMEEELEINLELKSLRTCKFTEVLNPVTTPELTVIVKYNITENLMSLKAIGQDKEKSYFSFSGIYKVT